MFKYLSDISDKGLRTEILKLKDPTQKIMEDFITEWVAIKASNKNADKTHQKASSIEQAAGKEKWGNPSKNEQTGGRQTGGANENCQKFIVTGKCLGCGKDHQRQDCLFKEATCHKCGNKGHIKTVCYSGEKGQQQGWEELSLIHI